MTRPRYRVVFVRGPQNGLVYETDVIPRTVRFHSEEGTELYHRRDPGTDERTIYYYHGSTVHRDGSGD